MADQFFAQLDANNVVIDVHVVTAEFMAANPERYVGIWVETFIDTVGKTYAGNGYVYSFETENFVLPNVVPPQPLST